MYRIKLRYKKQLSSVLLTVLERDGDGKLSAYPQHEFVLNAGYFQRGYVWHEIGYRLPVIAAGCAVINGRKNVCSTEADEGILY